MEKKQETMRMTWMSFYCFVRPWINIVLSLLALFNIIGYDEYQEIYFETTFGIITFVSLIIGIIISIMTFIKFKRKDYNTLTFLKYVLIYESISMAFNSSSRQTYDDLFEFLIVWAILSIIAYFIWYKSNMKYFRKREWYFNSKNDLDEYEDVENEDEIPEKKNIKNINKKYNGKFCKKCGGKITIKNQCSKCGHQYFSASILKQKNVVIIMIISLALLISIGCNIYLFNNSGNANEEIENLNDEISRLEDRNFDLLMDKIDYEAKANFLDDYIVIVPEGVDYYYSYDCYQKLFNGYTFYAYNVNAAIVKGYREGRCN